MSELHRQRILTGFAVVRRIDGENVFLPSGQLCRVVHPGAVDFHGMDAAQGTDQPFLVELTVIHFHEVHHTLQDCGTEGIGFALPCVHNQPQSLAVDFLAHLVVQLECSAYAADAVVAQLQAVIVEVQTHPVGGCEECHGKSILAHDLGTELDARRQRCSVTVLLCEEQGFLLHRQTRIHLAENREVFATVAQDTRFNGVLAVRHIIPAIAEADFRFVRRIFIEVSCNQLNALTLDAPLIKLARVDYDDQLEAYVEQAVLLYRQGKYQECIDAVETTQSRELKYYSRQSVANLYNVAAEAYYELESYESAATMYQKAIGYSPDILSYYQGEATALIQLGDYSGADEVLAEMAKAVPDAEQSGAYQVVQSELLRKQGDLPDALDAARKAIGSADGNDQLARAYRLAASICEDIGDSMLSEEINLLNQGIEQLPDGYYNALAGQLASAYIRQAEATGNPGYQKDALRTYQQLEKNGNTTLEVRLNIAMLQYQLHDFSKAMEMLQALKKDYPKDYRVYKWLAFVQGELDLQNGASYTKTLGYYETAAELYRAEQASGVYDPQMDELDRMARNNWQ